LLENKTDGKRVKKTDKFRLYISREAKFQERRGRKNSNLWINFIFLNYIRHTASLPNIIFKKTDKFRLYISREAKFQERLRRKNSNLWIKFIFLNYIRHTASLQNIILLIIIDL